MKTGEGTIAIMKQMKDGQKSFKEIAEELSLSETTARNRVRKLKDEGVLDISALADPEAIPGHTVVIIAVKLDTMQLVRKGEELSKLRGVVSVRRKKRALQGLRP